VQYHHSVGDTAISSRDDVGGLGVDVGGLDVDTDRLDVDVDRLSVDVGRLGIDVGRLDVDVDRLGIDVGRLGVDVDLDDLGINGTSAIVDLCVFSSFAGSSSFFCIFHQLVHIFLVIAIAIAIADTLFTILDLRQDARPNAPQPARNDRLLLLGATLEVLDVRAADAAACCCWGRGVDPDLGIGLGLDMGGGTAAVEVRVLLTAVFAGAAGRATRVEGTGCAAHQPFGVLDEFERRGEERDVRRAYLYIYMCVCVCPSFQQRTQGNGMEM
jgi:hypothetical protein